MMEIGPLTIRDTQNLEQLFEENGIEYSISIDEELKNSILNEFHADIRLRTTRAIGSLEICYIYFEVAENECLKVRKELERMGITINSS